MNKKFFLRIAIMNLKKNRRTYLPYILTTIAIVLMYFCMVSLQKNKSTGDEVLILMELGTWVVGFLSVIFVFYTNSFLMKRRKKEFGLFNILGMEKKHIAKILFWENTIVFFITMIAGILLGVLFSKLVFLLLAKMIHIPIHYSFEINFGAIGNTILIFCVVFILTLLNSLWQLLRARPIELLHGSAVGEKEPKSHWITTILGILSLGSGYYISLTIQDIFTAINLFFTAVLLVIIGTYLLFLSGSIVILKGLRKNKRFYYQTNHFVSVSGMIYRMKKNAVGLANICIMSTAVLVMVSTTVSLYIGIQDAMNTAFPHDIQLDVRYSFDDHIDTERLKKDFTGILKKDNMKIENVRSFEMLGLAAKVEENRVTTLKRNHNVSFNLLKIVEIMTQREYEKLTGIKLNLKKDEVACSMKCKDNILQINNTKYRVRDGKVRPFNDSDAEAYKQTSMSLVVRSAKQLQEIYQMQGEGDFIYHFACDLNEPKSKVNQYAKEDLFYNHVKKLKYDDVSLTYSSKQRELRRAYSLYGGLFFLGIFLGFLFLIATVISIYYKQVAEGMEDKERFRIMQKVGMSKQEVRKAIGSQIRLVFSLPLLVAVIHLIFAFPILKILLRLLYLNNTLLYIWCAIGTVGVFSVCYFLIYHATSKVYYKIVE